MLIVYYICFPDALTLFSLAWRGVSSRVESRSVQSAHDDIHSIPTESTSVPTMPMQKEIYIFYPLFASQAFS